MYIWLDCMAAWQPGTRNFEGIITRTDSVILVSLTILSEDAAMSSSRIKLQIYREVTLTL